MILLRTQQRLVSFCLPATPNRRGSGLWLQVSEWCIERTQPQPAALASTII